jgi:hypothetical protein
MCNAKTKEKVFQMSSENMDQKFSITMRAHNEDSINMYLYATHWIVNKCGLPVLMKVGWIF